MTGRRATRRLARASCGAVRVRTLMHSALSTPRCSPLCRTSFSHDATCEQSKERGDVFRATSGPCRAAAACGEHGMVTGRRGGTASTCEAVRTRKWVRRMAPEVMGTSVARGRSEKGSGRGGVRTDQARSDRGTPAPSCQTPQFVSMPAASRHTNTSPYLTYLVSLTALPVSA